MQAGRVSRAHSKNMFSRENQMELTSQQSKDVEHRKKANLVQYNLQQLDCSYVGCEKWAVIGIVTQIGDLFAYCRKHGRERVLEVLE